VKLLVAILILIVLGFGIVLVFQPESKVSHGYLRSVADEKSLDLPFQEGEELLYDVYFKALKVGESALVFHGEKKIDGNTFYHISFSTKLPTFEDTEEIYAYKESFLPFKVSRHIKRLGSFVTRIEEEYDQNAHKVTIKKKATFSSKELVIQKDAPIHNAILLTYFYRSKPVAEGEKTFKVTLPTVDFDISLKNKESIDTGLGEHDAYVFSAIPSKFTFWLSADDKKIPLKIDSHTAMDYSLIINSYTSK